jgi:DNA-binding NarL/FixJ family response regulator
VRVVVADDSVLLREGLVRLLTEVDNEVVAAVDDAPSFLRAVSEHRPDVAIVDVRMPPGMPTTGCGLPSKLVPHSLTWGS